MKLLVIGSGGREHALVWKLSQSPRVSKIYCALGNAGTENLATNVDITSLEGLKDFALQEKIDFTVVGPDAPLAGGIVDIFRSSGLRIFGPTVSAARLESSKSFAKDFMMRNGIPCAGSRFFRDSREANQYCSAAQYPLVIKADGLALGKGVTIVNQPQEAAYTIHRMMELKIFGEAGSCIVIEEFLKGTECSIHALIDGSTALVFPDVQDHKRALDGGLGPNTGGMGTLSPCPGLSNDLQKCIQEEVLDRFLVGIHAENIDFNGLLFPGLMLTASGPKVLEFNCRFGDPETQCLLRRLKSDFLDLLEACERQQLATVKPEWEEKAAACVVLASGGYPGIYKKGKEIRGIENAESDPNIVVFHAGTIRVEGQLLTNGGRVLGVTALGSTLPDAVNTAYRAADKIQFENLHRRNDLVPIE